MGGEDYFSIYKRNKIIYILSLFSLLFLLLFNVIHESSQLVMFEKKKFDRYVIFSSVCVCVCLKIIK